MALGKRQPIRFVFYDADGDKGEWWFTPESTRGLSNLVVDKYGTGTADVIYGQVTERTIKCDGPAMSLAEDHEYDGTVYKAGTVIPLDDPELREYFIREVVPESVVLAAFTEISQSGRVRSPQEWKEFQRIRPPVVQAPTGNGKTANRRQRTAEPVEKLPV